MHDTSNDLNSSQDGDDHAEIDFDESECEIRTDIKESKSDRAMWLCVSETGFLTNLVLFLTFVYALQNYNMSRHLEVYNGIGEYVWR